MMFIAHDRQFQTAKLKTAVCLLFTGELVVVVSHELVIREICRHADPMVSNGSEIPNASISVVHIFSSDGRWTVEKFGDVEHLVGEVLLASASGDGASA